jgi:hypothetical protein
MSSPTSTDSYEFNEQQNELISSLASCMGVMGIILLIVGALKLLVGALKLLAGAVTIVMGGAVALSAGIEGLLWLVIGGLTLKAAGAFRQIVSSTGNDMDDLMRALGTLRDLYRLQVIAVVAAVAAGLLFVLLIGLFRH